MISWVVRAVSGFVGFALVAGLASCGGADDPEEELVLPGESPVPEVSPTPGLTQEEAAAAVEILEIYDGYRELLIELQAAPDGTPEWPSGLDEFLAQPLRGSVGNDVNTMFYVGIERTGRPDWDPVVTEVRLDDEPQPTALLRDCLDATEWVVVDRESGEPVDYDSLGGGAPRPAPERQVREYFATFDDHAGRWFLDNVRVLEEEQC